MALPYIDIALPGIPPYRLMHVPGGEFLMGADVTDKEAENDEKPAHRVHLDEFYIGRFPVTQDLWEAVMGENPSKFKGPRRPVEQVSWNEINQQFLPRLNELAGKKIRLPTEAEWEFAARACSALPSGEGRGGAYSGSDVLEQVGWYYSSSGNATRDVGLLLPNALGLYDMSGNVWEWCEDWYRDGYYVECKKQGMVYNPPGPWRMSGRILRGGSWLNSAKSCRVSRRPSSRPDIRRADGGFRLALVP